MYDLSSIRRRWKLPRFGDEAGVTVLITLLALLITALVGIIVARVAATEMEVAGNYRGSHQAFYAADGGAEYGLNELLELGRARGRFPTSTEMATIAPPALGYINYTNFNIQSVGPMTIAPLTTGFFQGLVAATQPFGVVATAETTNEPIGTASIAMTANFDIIPIFQFAIFYEEDLELLPGPDMWLDGRVHSNQDIYIGTHGTLTINSVMTSAGDIYNRRKDSAAAMNGDVRIRDSTGGWPAMAGLDSDDPNWETEALNRWDGNVRSQDHDVTRLNLTIEDPTDPHKIIEAGRPGDTAADQDAKIYYEAGLRIINGQAYDSAGAAVSSIDPVTGTNAIRQTVIFDQREQRHMLTTEIDMEKLGRSPAWPANGIIYAGGFEPGNGMPSWNGGGAGVGPPPWTGYPPPWSNPDQTEFAVKLTNGAELASAASVVSENPVYVAGNYNVVNKVGAAVMGDAVTILSRRWGDVDDDGAFDSDLDYSNLALNDRNALSTTVNAAVMVGNTDSIPGTQYNGGVENVLRFLERWSGDTLTYRGSIIDLWNSEYATGDWIYGSPIYTAPNRDWGFDTDFLDPANLPPGTPNVYTIRIVNWERRSQ